MADEGLDEERRVTVCAACLCASCWQGKFFCQEALTAGTTRRTVSELRSLDRESPDYWTAAASAGEERFWRGEP